MLQLISSKLLTILLGVAVVGAGIIYQYKEVLFQKAQPKLQEIPMQTDTKPSLTPQESNIRNTQPRTSNYSEPKTESPKEEDFSSYINASSNKSNVSVTIVDANGNLSTDASNAIANIYKKTGKSTSTSLIRGGFMRKSEFHELREGNSDVIEKLKLKTYTDYLAIGKIYYSMRKGTLVDETIVCNASISMCIISTSSKLIEQSFSIVNANGIGVTEAQAQENAFQKLLDKYYNEHSSL